MLKTLKTVAEKLRTARSVVLATHRHCDGDGVGAQKALYHALVKAGKSVRIVNVDEAPAKYDFLALGSVWETFAEGSSLDVTCDLALILDTNDGRLVEPLFSKLKTAAGEVLFIDHHPTLAKGPLPTEGSLIDTSAASTGELCYDLIRSLGIELDADIARGLYTSVAFDTQLFRYVKSHSASHLMAAELLKHETEPEEVHRRLFATYSVSKMSFLARALSRIEYACDSRVAFVSLAAEDFAQTSGGLDRDDSGDVVDLLMNVSSVEVAALLREDAPGKYKLSLRSKGRFEVLPIAESFGGGGHRNASGAHLKGSLADLKSRLLSELTRLVGAGAA